MPKKYSVHLINNTVNWNNTITSLWGQANENILQLTEQIYYN